MSPEMIVLILGVATILAGVVAASGWNEFHFRHLREIERPRVDDGCRHLDAVVVKSIAVLDSPAETVAWWCAACETQLPADWVRPFQHRRTNPAPILTAYDHAVVEYIKADDRVVRTIVSSDGHPDD